MKGRFTHEGRAAAREAIVAQAAAREAGAHDRRHSGDWRALVQGRRGGRWPATQVRDIVLRSRQDFA
jgi:hypothetical protein